jgi:ribose transport system permease protein
VELPKITFWKRFGSLIAFLAICLIFGILSDRFFTLSNFMNVARQVSINAIVACGMTLVIITGGIDLSVGSIVGLTGCIALVVMNATDSDFFGLFMGLASGAAVGLANGVLVAYFRLPPFIMTLATLTAARGLALEVTAGQPVTRSTPVAVYLGQGFVGPVPVPICLMVIIVFATHFILSSTATGSYIYSVGGNEEAARLSGVKVGRIKVFVYAVSGLCSALTGLILTARLASAQPNIGIGFELDAIAAVVLGGTSLMGGEGKITGTLLGAFVIGVLNNGFNLLNVSPYYQMIAMGLVIVIAILFDQFLKTRVKG